MKLITARPESITTMQTLLDSIPSFNMVTEGVTSMPNSAKNIFQDLPPQCSYEQKHVLYLQKEDQLIGAADIIIGYPNQNVAFIGLYFINEKKQGHGLGRAGYRLLEDFIRQFSVNSIQLGVVESNTQGMIFWTKLGYRPNGRIRPHQGLKVTSTVHVLEKKITENLY